MPQSPLSKSPEQLQKNQHLQAEKSLKKSRIYPADSEQQGSSKPGEFPQFGLAGSPAIREGNKPHTLSPGSAAPAVPWLPESLISLLRGFSSHFPPSPAKNSVPAPPQGRLHLVLAKPLGRSSVNQKPHLARAVL